MADPANPRWPATKTRFPFKSKRSLGVINSDRRKVGAGMLSIGAFNLVRDFFIASASGLVKYFGVAPVLQIGFGTHWFGEWRRFTPGLPNRRISPATAARAHNTLRKT